MLAEKRVKFTSNDARFLIDNYKFSIFPVYGMNDDMTCMCGNPSCTNQGKHPACPNGANDASNNIDEVLKLWDGRKGLNVGIATGKVSDFFVVDIDGPIGESDIEHLMSIHGQLPLTLTQTTGRGRHLFFKYPKDVEKVKNRSKVIGEKIDIRADGGYIVGYKSTHKTGAVYDFVNPLDDIAECPEWLLKIVLADNKKEPSNVLNIYDHKPTLSFTKNEWSKEQILELLSYIEPDDVYDQWYQIGMALKDYGISFNTWDDWSKKGAKYDASIMASKWNSFKGKGVTIGTLVYHAKNRGWSFKQEEYKLKPQPQSVIYDDLKSEVVDPITGEVTEVIENSDIPETFEMFFADEIQPVTSCSDFVEDLLRDNEFSVIYGASNCGKTFFMLDLAMHVALGKEWRGKQVDQGGVIYAALEGGHGTKNRIVAFRNHYGITGKISLAVIPSSINFVDDKKEDLQKLINSIAKEKQRLGNIKLIVIDTLARAISGKDENSSLDMGSLISNVDEIRKITGAHIAFVHHSGKDDLKGARGHSSLRAAVDTEIEVSRPDTESPSTIKIVKQREMEMIDDMSFSLSRIVLGVNERGKEVTSCVVLPCEVIEKKETKKLNPIQTFIYDALIGTIDAHGQERQIYPNGPKIKCVSYDELRVVMEFRGFKKMMETEKKTTAEQIKSATQTARMGLKKLGKINFDGNYIWPNYE